jgi:hypothetical protein
MAHTRDLSNSRTTVSVLLEAEYCGDGDGDGEGNGNCDDNDDDESDGAFESSSATNK